MQAIMLFTLFGLFSLTIGGIIAYTNLTTQRLRLALIDETRQQFSDTITLVLKHLVREDLQSPAPAGNKEAIATYLCGIEDAREIIDCSTGTAQDPWHHDLAGWALRENQLLYTQDGLMFTVPVTVYALVSAGPDGTVNTKYASGKALTAKPANAGDLTSLSPAGDDIVQVFTDMPAQEENAAAIDDTFHKITLAAQHNYLEQFYQFKQKLATVYGVNDVLVDKNGLFVINSTKVLNLWKQDPTAPGYQKLLKKNGDLDTYALGVDGDVTYVQRPLDSGGNMTIAATVGDSGSNGINDILNLWINLGGTVWQQPVTPNCNSTPPRNCVAVGSGI